MAYRQPTFQVSTYTDQYGAHPARLANDGSRQTNYAVTTNGCAASEPETNPWWAVDLGVATIVFFINLTNRGDADGIYLHRLPSFSRMPSFSRETFVQSVFEFLHSFRLLASNVVI